MKRYTTPNLEVILDIPVETVAEIKFLFKQKNERTAPTLLLKTYPGDVKHEDGIYKVPFSVEDTGRFAEDEHFYMDTLITDQTGNIPQTPIVRLFMSKTLFTYEEVMA